MVVENNLEGNIFQPDEWIIYHQYESGLEPLREYRTFSQSSKVIVHIELFDGQRAMERLSQQFFEMY